MGALEADMENVKAALFGKGAENPGFESRLAKMEKTMMRMEAVWDSLIGLAKIIGGIVGFAVVVCELLRAIESFHH